MQKDPKQHIFGSLQWEATVARGTNFGAALTCVSGSLQWEPTVARGTDFGAGQALTCCVSGSLQWLVAPILQLGTHLPVLRKDIEDPST